MQDKGWISPPDSMTSGSSESAATLSQVSLANSSNGPDLTDPITPHCFDDTERREYSHNFSSVGSALPGLPQPESEKTQVCVFSCTMRQSEFYQLLTLLLFGSGDV